MKSNQLIRLSKSCIGEAEKKAVMSVLDREFLGMGTDVLDFEKLLTEFFGRPAVCVANGTAALHLAIQACDIGRGDEVIVPSLTYVASFQAISATGAKPVPCEVDCRTLTLDCSDAKARLTSRTRAIMPVHYSGGVGDLDGIYDFAQQHRLRIIEDAAHAFGSTHNDKRIGSFGDVACFSFDGIKNITSAEGGCIVTDDLQVLERVRDARLLGVEKDTEMRYAGQRSWQFDVSSQGWRYHMSNIMAAIGLEQLKRFDEFAKNRRARALLYDKLFLGHPRITPMPHNYDAVVPHIYVVRISGLSDRNRLQARLLEQGIQTGIHYQPNHLLSLFKNNTSRSLLATESIYAELLTIPLHPELSEDDVRFVAAILKKEVG